MQSAGLVAISLLGGVLLVVILGGMCLLGYFMLQARKVAAGHSGELKAMLDTQKVFLVSWLEQAEEVVSESRTENEAFSAENKAIIEGLKSSLTSSRAESRTTQAEFSKDIKAILKSQNDEMKKRVESINGEALQAASIRAINACLRIEKITALLQGMLLTHNEREESPTGLGAEEYAPDDAGTIYDQNPTAKQDALFDFDEETVENG